MKVAVTGSHGLIGRHLVPALDAAGHRVIRVVRAGSEPGTLTWDPEAGLLDATALEGVDAVIHLAGRGVASRRWNDAHRRAVRDSRVAGTSLLARTIAGLDGGPKVFLCASAIGYYGDRGDEVLTERSPSGSGFLPGLCREWEAAAAAAGEGGVRTVVLRTGVVQAADGGALKAQLPIFKLGLGGRLGSGRQWVSWISVTDEVGAILHVLDDDRVSGPVNLVAPEPVTNAEYTRILASNLGRPHLLAVPSLALRTVLGSDMAEELLLASQRVEPTALTEAGYVWRHRRLANALAAELRRP